MSSAGDSFQPCAMEKAGPLQRCEAKVQQAHVQSFRIHARVCSTSLRASAVEPSVMKWLAVGNYRSSTLVERGTTGGSWGGTFPGSGSGSSMYVLAMSLCRHVDIFGFGIFRGGPEAISVQLNGGVAANHGAGGIVEDIRYAHFYDSHPHHWKDTCGLFLGLHVNAVSVSQANSSLPDTVWMAWTLLDVRSSLNSAIVLPHQLERYPFWR
eukprot:2905510-Amphidinium_carterae.1